MERGFQMRNLEVSRDITLSNCLYLHQCGFEECVPSHNFPHRIGIYACGIRRALLIRLELTEKGASCIQTVKNVAEEIRELVFRGMTPEEVMLFRRLLIQINTNLE